MQALLRDIPFNALSAGILDLRFLKDKSQVIPLTGVVNRNTTNQVNLRQLRAEGNDVKEYLKVTEELKKLKWYSGAI